MDTREKEHFQNPLAEAARLRALYKRLAQEGRLRLPVSAQKALAGPDTAYHLYWQVKGKPQP